MKIIDLTSEHYDAYFNCLSEWSDEMKEAGDHKAGWYNKYKDKGLRVKLVLDKDGAIGGMIQYLPIEESFIEGKDLFFILCIWVHGYKKGRGNFQGKGMGRELLSAAESDVKERGAKGMAAWGVWLPFWMKASWFKKHGYKKADRDSMSLLVWKPFTDDANPPSWMHQKKEVPADPGKVTVTAFINGWCPSQNIVYERAKRACAEFGEKVIFKSIDTSDRDVFLGWGISDGVFINEKQISFGPPLSFDKIMKKISKQVKKISK
jgi:GNAT superfamily N-acetyltransferase